MRSILAALALFLASVSAALAQQSVVVPATTASLAITGGTGTSLLVTGATGKRIYVTSVDVIPSGASTVQFISGTGPACGTGTVNITGAYTFTTNQTLVKGSGYGAIWALDPGLSLCMVIGVAVAPGSISYAQF